MNTPVLIPAAKDVQSWKLLLNRCPKWLLSMQFTKEVTRGKEREGGLAVFAHPSCVKACEEVLQYAKDHGQALQKDSKPWKVDPSKITKKQ